MYRKGALGLKNVEDPWYEFPSLPYKNYRAPKGSWLEIFWEDNYCIPSRKQRLRKKGSREKYISDKSERMGEKNCCKLFQKPLTVTLGELRTKHPKL